MKPLLIVFLALAVNECKSQSYPRYGPGYDFKLFRNTPVRELADAVESDDPVRVRAAVHAEKAYLDFQEPKFGSTLLKLTVLNKKVFAAKVLLDSGANPNLRSPKNGSTPFLIACRFAAWNPKVLQILDEMVRHGADVNDREIRVDTTNGSVDTMTTTALQHTVQSGKLAAVKLLIDNGAKLDAQPKKGVGSLLFLASAATQLDILRYLLIEKKIPVPEYLFIRNEGDPNAKEMTLRQLLMERAPDNDPVEVKELKEILAYLKSKGR
jgi:ankyrin repeat protein